MSKYLSTSWKPRIFRRFERNFSTSTGVAKIITDAGPAYLKALGNNEGPHALARELIGTSIAKWMGIPTLEYNLFDVTTDDEIPLGHDKKALPGPAFITKAINATPWGGDVHSLKKVKNKDDITKIVLLDTWILNNDRYPPLGSNRKPNPDNLLIVNDNEQSIICIDHTHCLYHSSSLSRKICEIGFIKDSSVRGLFPCFCTYITRPLLESTLGMVKKFDSAAAQQILNLVLKEWMLNQEINEALTSFLQQRAAFLQENMAKWIEEQCNKNESLFL